MLDEASALYLVDRLVETLEAHIDDFNERLSAIEAYEGRPILCEIDEDRTDYKQGTLASIGGGALMIFDKGRWRPAVNGIEAVRFEGDVLVVERTDGTIQRSPITKPTKAKHVRVAA